MSYLLYFDRLTAREKRAVSFTWAVFILIESIALVIVDATLLSIMFAVVTILVFLLWFRKDAARQIFTLPFGDLLIFAFILLFTIRPLVIPRPSSIPQGYFVARIDLEILAAVLVTLCIAILFPALNDIRHLDKIRAVEYLKFVPFGLRRGFTSIIALIVLFAITGLFIYKSEGLAASTSILIGCGICAQWLFCNTYGYRSYIMVFVGGFGLVAIGALALVVHLPRINLFLNLLPVELKAIICGAWVTGWFAVVGAIWVESRKSVLVPEQNIYHILYVMVLGTGQVAIFIWWVLPFIKWSVP